jgi:Immunity protein 17
MGVYILFALLGLFFFISAVLEWEWIYATWDVAAIRAILGEGAARIFCGVIGLMIFVVSAVRWAGR